jgi:hypothetical protein
MAVLTSTQVISAIAVVVGSGAVSGRDSPLRIAELATTMTAANFMVRDSRRTDMAGPR